MTPELQDEIEKYALKHHISKSQAIRSLLEKALSQTSLIDEQNQIRGYIREELKITLEYLLSPHINRIEELAEVGTKTSASSLLCLISVLTEIYYQEASSDEILANALKMAAKITKEPVKSDEEYIIEAQEWLDKG